jgi:hypothetical protein
MLGCEWESRIMVLVVRLFSQRAILPVCFSLKAYCVINNIFDG